MKSKLKFENCAIKEADSKIILTREKLVLILKIIKNIKSLHFITVLHKVRGYLYAGGLTLG